jgi:ABC-type polysaccharide/polyol phosphate transport system ATPase subunit
MTSDLKQIYGKRLASESPKSTQIPIFAKQKHQSRRMSRIRIKNFGPIKGDHLENDGWLDVAKVTVFIGNQGTGKSTVAKLISTFTCPFKGLGASRGKHE